MCIEKDFELDEILKTNVKLTYTTKPPSIYLYKLYYYNYKIIFLIVLTKEINTIFVINRMGKRADWRAKVRGWIP